MNAGVRSKRRFLALAAAFCLALLPPAAFAQKPQKVWRIGLCHVGLDHEPPGLQSLLQALNAMGYIDRRSLRWNWRNQPDAAAADAQVKQWWPTVST